MDSLSTAQLLYLFYAFAYTEPDSQSVTQGTVKQRVPKKYRGDAQQICEHLLQSNLLESPKRSRVALTPTGIQTLVGNLQTTDYQFTTNKGAKVSNALLECVKLAASGDVPADKPAMSFETFVDKFKELYFEDRKRQELKGLAVIYTEEICKDFVKKYPSTEGYIDTYFDRLKSEGYVFAVVEKDKEIIQWAE